MAAFKESVRNLRLLSAGCWGRVVVRCLIGLVRIAASLSFVWISKHLIDLATGKVPGELRNGIVAMVVIMLVQMLTGLFAAWYETVILVRTNNEIRLRLFSRVMCSRWIGKEKFHSGDTVNRLENDISVLGDLVCTRIPDVVITVCQLIAASLFMLTLSPKLLWLLLGLMIVAVLGSKLFFRRIRNLTNEIRTEESRIQSCMQDNLLYRVLALTLYGPARVTSRMSSMQDVVYDRSVERLNLTLIARLFMTLGFGVGYVSAFIWGVTGIKAGTVTFGTMTAFLQLVGQIQGPIAQISRHIPAFIHALTSVDRLAELNGLEQERQGRPILMEQAPEIRVENVTYAYSDKDGNILDNFSCVFPAGKMSAVMGPTGAGKSTLIRLILGLLEPSEGSISMNAAGKCCKVSADTRCNFIYVPQGNTMMSGTVRENFLFANPDATEEQMTEAVRLAAAEFILDLPDGLDTVCGEVGGGLSEGQSQRLAIARSLLHPGSVLVLDESTSALDAATESRLLENLSARFGGDKTIIFITHREAVAEKASAVVRL